MVTEIPVHWFTMGGSDQDRFDGLYGLWFEIMVISGAKPQNFDLEYLQEFSIFFWIGQKFLKVYNFPCRKPEC